jgi:LEA14-like dessication related protein
MLTPSAPRARAGLRSALAAATVLACLGAPGGCVHKPTVQLDRAQVSNVSLYGVGLDVLVRVNNTNSFDVMVRDVNAQVTINNKYSLAPMRLSPNQWLASDKTTLVAVPVVIPWTVVPGLLAETIGRDTLTYRVTGTADVTATKLLQVQRNNHPLNEEGKLSRAALLSAARTRFPAAY